MTIELESASLTGSAAPAGLARPESAGSRSWQRSAEHWAALAPRGLYASAVRTPLLWLVALGLVALALLPALAITLANLVVRENRAKLGNPEGGGAGLLCTQVQVSDCLFADNRATGGGGLLLREPQDATVERCVFERNEATSGANLEITGKSEMRW